MKFRKVFGGVCLAVGAAVAAPFVIPALGATALGGAIVTGAAAAGTAVATAAAAAGTAITSTAVGGAIAGATTTAMAGVGTAVGAAAGAVGLGSVAAVAGTTTGAAALGTIATTGVVGVSSGVSGAVKISEAVDIKDKALKDYQIEKGLLDHRQYCANKTLEKLGAEKLKIWDSFNRFVTVYSKIQNPPVMAATVSKESIALSTEELDNIKAVAISVKKLFAGGVSAVGAGGLIGMATSGGLVSSITVASTGTAMSTLSGVAATNATMAAFGGGSLAVGGAGMAGGATVLGGLTFAPMLMVGGIVLNSQAQKSLKAAKGIKAEARMAIEKIRAAKQELHKVGVLAEEVFHELGKLNASYQQLVGTLETIVKDKTDYRAFSMEEKKTLERTILVLKLIKQVSMQDILDHEHGGTVLAEEVQRTLSHSKKTYLEGLAA